MKIHVPFPQVAKLVTDLVKSLKGGIDKDEAHQLAQDLLDLGLALLAQVKEQQG